jgi:hypothetical protein
MPDELPDIDAPVFAEEVEEEAVALSMSGMSAEPPLENVDEPTGEIVIEVTDLSEEEETPAEIVLEVEVKPQDSIGKFMETIPSVADAPGEDATIASLNGRVVNFDEREPGAWSGGSVRAGVEGMSYAGFGNTCAEALINLRIAAGDLKDG